MCGATLNCPLLKNHILTNNSSAGSGAAIIGCGFFEYVFSKIIANGCRLDYTEINKEAKVSVRYG